MSSQKDRCGVFGMEVGSTPPLVGGDGGGEREGNVGGGFGGGGGLRLEGK